MSWQYALAGPQVGLQFIGQHPRSRSSLPQMLANLVSHGIGTMQTQLNVALQHPAHYAAYPGDIIDPAHTLFVPRSLVFRLSKWCDHAGAGETDARKFTRALFRHGNELRAIPPRFLDQEDEPIDPRPSTKVLKDFEAWADRVIAAWHGIPNKPAAISAALGAW
jgi:hypothetical protein